MLEQITALNHSQMWVHSKGRRRLTIYICFKILYFLFFFICIKTKFEPRMDSINTI